MYLLASTDTGQLERWRAAFEPEQAVVELRHVDALLQCLGQLRPQAILLDARMCRPSGPARLVCQVLEIQAATSVIVFAPDGGDELELGLFLAGARGFCLADTEPLLVRRVVEAVTNGELWIRRNLMPLLVDTLTRREDAVPPEMTGRFAILTPREIEIARMIGQGASNKRIARALSITERTVKAHLTMIFRKTGMDDRLKLALMVSRRH